MGLCLALAGLMVVGVSSAQAEVGAKWLVGGVAVTNALKAELLGSLENNHGVLLGEIGGVGIHILCTGFTFVVGSILLIEGGWSGKGQFSGCKVLRLITLNGKAEVLPDCEPAGGLITTVTLKGLLGLHKLSSGTVDTVTVIQPAVGAAITTVGMGEECLFGEKVTISGKVAAIDSEIGVSQVSHLFKEFAPLTELYLNGNKANKATLDGSAEVKLAGAHENLSWSGDPF